MVIGRPAQLIPRIFNGTLIGWSQRIHTAHLLGVFIAQKPSTPWFHRMFVHLETPTPSCSIAFSSILGPHHLQSIFSTWHQETGALGFWAFSGLQRQLSLVPRMSPADMIVGYSRFCVNYGIGTLSHAAFEYCMRTYPPDLSLPRPDFVFYS